MRDSVNELRGNHQLLTADRLYDFADEIMFLRSGLRFYGDHRPYCKTLKGAEKCNCGFAEALKGIVGNDFAPVQEKTAPPGFEHLTQEAVAAIRDTCMTHADRVGKTQDEVFRAADSAKEVK